MILIDTSVWIEFFKQDKNTIKTIIQLQNSDKLGIIQPIVAELLYGAKEHEVAEIMTTYNYCEALDIKDSTIHAGLFSIKEKFLDKGIGLIDSIIIYTTITSDIQIWTLDKKIINYLDNKFIFTP